MTLEFHKLTLQVDQMSAYLASQRQDHEDRIVLALRILEANSAPAFLPYILERVQDAVDKDAGYRGARPLDEAIMDTFPPAPLPGSATVVATDGSQIPPDTHGSAMYYLINTGTIIVHHGSGNPPQIASEPALFYADEHMRQEEGGVITAATVAARRTVAEMAALAEHAWHQRGEARPLVALLDNPLLFIGIGNEVPDRNQLRRIYFSAMTRLLDIHAGLAGYTDRPHSRYVIGLLHLLDTPIDEVTRARLSTAGRLEGLVDRFVFRSLLRPAERSALFVQMSPLNKEFRRDGGETHEIAFFYMNTAAQGPLPNIARVEVPMWVAQDRPLVSDIQALIYHQCQQLTTPYPYILTRAHELAIVKHEESRQLNMMIQVTMIRHGLETSESAKQVSKDTVGGARTRFEVR
jgi:hypothetical protein